MKPPSRKLRIEVYAKGRQDQLSVVPAVLVVSNPQPELPTGVAIAVAFDTIFFSYTAPDDPDFTGIIVWMSKTSGFTPGSANQVYDGPDTSFTLGPLDPSASYYIRYAPYDAFGKTGLNVSSEIKKTTIQIIGNQIAPFQVSDAHIKNLSAEKIIAGTALLVKLFLGRENRFLLDGENTVLSIKDSKGVVRVRIGKLGPGILEWGAHFCGPDGNVLFGTDGLSTDIVTPLNLSKVAREALGMTGDIKMSARKTNHGAWLILQGGTIGNSDSGASGRANEDTLDLYVMLWNDYTNTDIPVAGGRGSSAKADFDLNKKLTLLNYKGRAPVGAGAGSGLTNRPLGSKFGAETVRLTSAQNGSHYHVGGKHGHGNVAVAGYGGGIGLNSEPRFHQGSTDLDGAVPTSSSGSGSPHENIQPSIATNFFIKL